MVRCRDKSTYGPKKCPRSIRDRRVETDLRAKLGAEELADLSRIALQSHRQVRDVEYDRLDAVALALHLADDTRHLVPTKSRDNYGSIHVNPHW